MVKKFQKKNNRNLNTEKLFFVLDADKNNINYKTEYLLDGRKQIFYEPTVVGNVKLNEIFYLKRIFF